MLHEPLNPTQPMTMLQKTTFRVNSTKKAVDIAALMGAYLKHFELPVTKGADFVEDYMRLVVEKAIEKGERLPFPQNLGYMQVLRHSYIGRNKEHLRKFGNADYSLVWIKHPLFRLHRINASKQINETIKSRVLGGQRYLEEYVDGDTYVA